MIISSSDRQDDEVVEFIETALDKSYIQSRCKNKLKIKIYSYTLLHQLLV